MDEPGSSDSWNKLVISKQDKNNVWIANIKSEPEADGSTTGFCLDYDSYCNRNSDAPDDNPIDYHTYQDPIFPTLIAEAERRSRLAEEAPEHRLERLAKMSAYAAQRLASESPEQRATRLKRMSEYAAKRLANETSEQRALRLARMSAYAAKRLAKETPEQRQERLTRMSAYAAKRQAMRKLNTVTGETKKRRKTSTRSDGKPSKRSNTNEVTQ